MVRNVPSGEDTDNLPQQSVHKFRDISQDLTCSFKLLLSSERKIKIRHLLYNATALWQADASY